MKGKGKVAHHLLKSGEYTHCIRFNGGQNAGHTIYHKNKKFVTHIIPQGVFFGVRSIIGPGCVFNVEKLLKEIYELTEAGIDLGRNLKIAHNAHIILEHHILEDSKDVDVGATKTGNGPAYRDKYYRQGVRAEQIPFLQPFLVDIYEELYNKDSVILMEGAQGWMLDPDWGDYPYVTSSHTGVASALLNGVEPRSIRDVWGVGKIYETYVGKKDFQPPGNVFNKIQKAGSEFGATTGRVRQCNWLDFNNLRQAIHMNSVNKLVLNKVDILREVGEWQVKNPDVTFNSEEEMRSFISQNLSKDVENIFFSESPKTI